ncbi:MSHA biogenesis protein MshQ [Vibrio ponticus]|nr:MSHA biogenesis protein MshQ [Vibrio ponticus]
MAGNPNIKDTNHLIYSPVAFKFNDGEVKQLIAGKQDTLSVQVLACADDGNTVTGNYSKTFSQSDLQNTYFLPGVWAGNETKLNFAAEIKNGQADATIQFNEAGEYTGTLKDVVSCDAFKQAGVTPLDCPEGESKEISGILKFKARPWTFAVCNSDLTALPSGDISNVSSAGFTAAGEKFDIAVLPIRWQSGGSVTSSIATQDSYCNTSQVTANFAKGEAGTLQIQLAHTLPYLAVVKWAVLVARRAKAIWMVLMATIYLMT